MKVELLSINPTQQKPDSTKHVGLHCRKCGERRFRVIYTRGTWDGKIVRRRECRHCGRRVTTREHMIGQ
jgi:DNA-directed RNA polymerase subunit RPC12/RpoP